MLIRIASLFNRKAKLWLNGRINFRKKIIKDKGKLQNAIWFHCASLGEFEQGRPLIELIRAKYPEQKIILSFYSPSGYEIRKDYTKVDFVFYLPLDTKRNAAFLVQHLNPKAFILIKYEFWFNLLNAFHNRNIPTFLVAGIFRKDHFIFKPMASSFRKTLQGFTQLFVQRTADVELLEARQFTNVQRSGDPRLDRVIQIQNESFDDPIISNFIDSEKKLIIAGSTWPKDEFLIKEVFESLKSDFQLLIVPHETDKAHIKVLKAQFSKAILYSESRENNKPNQVLIIDQVGILAYIYRYADIVYIGGGFGKGIHNILEAAVYSKPIFFGPNWQKFEEAHQFLQNKVAFEVENSSNLLEKLEEFERDDKARDHIKNYINNYKTDNQSISSKILETIKLHCRL